MYKFSDKIQGVKASAIREILKAAQTKGTISFAAGNPASQSFPIEKIQKISAQILNDIPNVALQYSLSEGVRSLRQNIVEMLQRCDEKFIAPNDSCIVTSGAQQGLDFVAKVFLNEGDGVICENPTFVSAINTFKSYGANLIGVPMEPDGMCIKSLKNAIQQNKGIKLLYIIPNFQNPTGYTTSLEKRREIYRLCYENNIIILEDNPYGDLRYAGSHVRSLKSIDFDSERSIVIYVGSFSKVISPGLRVGYMVANNEVMERAVVAKQCSDVHTAVLPQLICDSLIADADSFGKHIEQLKELYKSKLELMCGELDKHLSGTLTYEKPAGGLFIWCKVAENIPADELCRRCVAHGIAVVPGIAFSADGAVGSQYIRLNFSTPSEQEIVEGVQRLARAVAEFA